MATTATAIPRRDSGARAFSMGVAHGVLRWRPANAARVTLERSDSTSAVADRRSYGGLARGVSKTPKPRTKVVAERWTRVGRTTYADVVRG